MSDDALLATMTELTTYLNLRDEHRAAIDAAHDALEKLEGEIHRLRAELARHLHHYALGDFAPPPTPLNDPWLELAAPITREYALGDITPLSRSERARKAGLASAARLTPKQRSERARRANAARWGKAHAPAIAFIGDGGTCATPAQAEMLIALRNAPEEGLPAREFVPRGKRGAAAPLGQLCRRGMVRKLPNGNWVAA